MAALRQLRQPDVSGYETSYARRLDIQINAAYDRLMAAADDPLTADQWRRVFLLWDARRLLEWGMVSEAAHVLAKAVRS